MKFLNLVWSHMKISIANEMQYRVNFFVQLLHSLISLATGLIGIWLVFSYTNNLGGWNQPELLAVMGIFMMMGGFIQAAVTPNMQRLMGDIQEGTLDFSLTKPVDAQLLASVREFQLWQLTDLAAGVIVLIIAVARMQVSVGIWQVAGFMAALVMGAIMLYCFWLMLTTTAFWLLNI